jgi:carboxymethylenebutenolidase
VIAFSKTLLNFGESEMSRGLYGLDCIGEEIAMFRRSNLTLMLLAMTLSLSTTALSHAGTLVIPPSEAGAKAALETSVRHHEWVKIGVPGTELKLNTFVAYPERKDKAPVVVVIQEVYGLTDWIRGVADRLAGDGFIAIAPDLLSGKGPGGGGTEAFSSRDDVVKAVRDLSAPDVVSILNAVIHYGTSLPAATQKFATVGFCWGGAQSFYYATAQPNLSAAIVYYGTSPPQEALTAIHAPVLGLYGEDDARVTSTIQPAAEKMKELGKTYITHIYKSAGHGFLRAQEERAGANLDASRQAWPVTIEFLRKNLE